MHHTQIMQQLLLVKNMTKPPERAKVHRHSRSQGVHRIRCRPLSERKSFWLRFSRGEFVAT